MPNLDQAMYEYYVTLTKNWKELIMTGRLNSWMTSVQNIHCLQGAACQWQAPRYQKNPNDHKTILSEQNECTQSHMMACGQSKGCWKITGNCTRPTCYQWRIMPSTTFSADNAVIFLNTSSSKLLLTTFTTKTWVSALNKLKKSLLFLQRVLLCVKDTPYSLNILHKTKTDSPLKLYWPLKLITGKNTKAHLSLCSSL